MPPLLQIARLFAMKWQRARPAWHVLCAAAAVAVLFGAAGIALDVAWVPGGSDIDAGDALPEQAGPEVRAARRCPHCGWIESKREVPSSVADPRSLGVYEYTVRMADGSSSVFQAALPTSWRLGERLSVIDGASPPP